MKAAKSGDTIKVQYTGRLDDGSIFETSEGRDPLSFTIGRGEVIPGFEDAVIGMEVGETKTAKVVAKSAFGERASGLLFDVARDSFPEDIDPEPGMVLEIRRSDGRKVPITVSKIDETTVILDANHPLAGKDLTFKITLVEIA